MNSKENIHLVLTGLYNEDYSRDSGGIQLAEISFSESAAFHGHSITVYAGAERNGSRIGENGENICEVGLGDFPRSGGILDSWVFGLKTAALIAESIRNDEPDLVHFTSVGPALFFFSEVVKHFQQHNEFPPIVYTLHNFHYAIAQSAMDIFTEYPDEWQLLHDQETSLIEQADGVFITNSILASQLSERFGRDILHVPNTIGNLERYDGPKIKSPFNVVLSMSRLAAEKNIPNVIEAVVALFNTDEMLRLVVSGNGEQRNELLGKMKYLDIPTAIFEEEPRMEQILEVLQDNKVVFTGNVKNKLKDELWRLADVFICPSFREVSPLVGLEALAYGLPIVGSTIPGWFEFAEYGADVFLADPLSPESIQEELKQVLTRINWGHANQISETQRSVYTSHYHPNIVIPQRISAYNYLQKKYEK